MIQPATPQQLVLDIGIEIQRDVNGIEMGVLENGLPFLTQRGLIKLTGMARSVIFDITQDWERRYFDPVLGKDRNSVLREHLAKNGYDQPKLYIETKKDGTVHYAYPDVVCMAVLEYYAFVAKTPSQQALDNYRRLATYGLQKFIYDSLGYVPTDKWKYHHDRVSILQNSAPDGYWIIFHEVTGLIVDLINADLIVNHKTIPDISVGTCWGDHWATNNLAGLYGARTRYPHDYPAYYPQAKSNPQALWAYPDASLAVFRKWFKGEYLPTRFPKYILTKAHLLGGQHAAQKIANLYQPKLIGGLTA